MMKFKQTPANLLAEIELMLYCDARIANLTLGTEKTEPEITLEDLRELMRYADPVTRRDREMKGRLMLVAAEIMHDYQKNDGKNVPAIAAEAAAKGITLFNCDVRKDMIRLMPPP